MKTWYKNRIFIAVAVLVVLVAGWFLLFNNDSGTNGAGNNNEASSALEKHADGVRVVGQIECLPYRKSTDDQGCVKGIKDSEDRYYALNSLAVRGAEHAMPLGTSVVATGEFQPADTRSSESNVFSYYGVLVLKSLKRQ